MVIPAPRKEAEDINRPGRPSLSRSSMVDPTPSEDIHRTGSGEKATWWDYINLQKARPLKPDQRSSWVNPASQLPDPEPNHEVDGFKAKYCREDYYNWVNVCAADTHSEHCYVRYEMFQACFNTELADRALNFWCSDEAEAFAKCQYKQGRKGSDQSHWECELESEVMRHCLKNAIDQEQLRFNNGITEEFVDDVKKKKCTNLDRGGPYRELIEPMLSSEVVEPIYNNPVFNDEYCQELGKQENSKWTNVMGGPFGVKSPDGDSWLYWFTGKDHMLKGDEIEIKGEVMSYGDLLLDWVFGPDPPATVEGSIARPRQKGSNAS